MPPKDISKESNVVKVWHLPSMGKKWKVASIGSMSRLQSPCCTAHPFLPTCHRHSPEPSMCSAAPQPLPPISLPAPRVGSRICTGSILQVLQLLCCSQNSRVEPPAEAVVGNISDVLRSCVHPGASLRMWHQHLLTLLPIDSLCEGQFQCNGNNSRKQNALQLSVENRGCQDSFSSCLLSTHPQLMSAVSKEPCPLPPHSHYKLKLRYCQVHRGIFRFPPT